MTPCPKPQRSERRLAKHKQRTELKSTLKTVKAAVRKRDGHRCRFPLCGCRKLGIRLEVAHQQHSGMGGDRGTGSTSDNLITMCVQRHQDGVVSRHHGTLRIRLLTDSGTNGPVAFDVENLTLLKVMGIPVQENATVAWCEVARESAVQQLYPLTEWQCHVLPKLAEMKF